jgi:hypothetical protein
MEDQPKKNKIINKRYYDYLSLKNLSPEQWDELPEWEDLSDEINLLFNNKEIEY